MSTPLGTKRNALERLSKNAKIALRNAALVMEHTNAKEITPENIFVGIILNEECLATRTIEAMGIDRSELLKRSFNGKSIEITVSPDIAKELVLSSQSQEILRKAYDLSRKYSHVYVGTEHILTILLQLKDSFFQELESIGLTERSFKNVLDTYASYPLGLLARPNIPNLEVERDDSVLDFLGLDLVQMAKDGKLDPVIGRDLEIDELINILSRRKKNNPIIVGEAGVGKTVLVEGLAQRIVSGHVPPSLRNIHIVSLDVASIMAGSKMRGDVEEKVMSIVEEVTSSRNTILFIDEIHNIVGSGAQTGSSDIASILKPALLRDDFRCIGATTTEEYSEYFETDNALARRFQPLFLKEASLEDTVKILKQIKPILEKHHNVKINDKALQMAATLSDRYVSDRYLPDKAIDLLDEAAASKRLEVEKAFSDISQYADTLSGIKEEKERAILKGEMARAEELQEKEEQVNMSIKEREVECIRDKRRRRNQIQEKEIREVLSKWTGIPVSTLGSKEKSSLLNLERTLGASIIGQKEACNVVASAIKRARAGISDAQRPWASFLFLGPTGVGKTELAKVLTKVLFGDEDRLIQIDMSEMMEMHSVSKLIGSPPGYIGFQQGGFLTEKVKRQPHSVILFDEIEKAHPDVLNILLQILEYGRLTDGRGKTVNFKNTIIILTSNIGAEDIKKNRVLGFTGEKGSSTSDENINKEYRSMKTDLLLQLKNILRPELLNRIDDIVIFRSLTRKDAKEIVELLINELNMRLESEGLKVVLSDKVINHLVKEGFSEEYGARPLRRLIQDQLENVVADYILSHKIKKGFEKEVSVDWIDGEVVILNN